MNLEDIIIDRSATEKAIRVDKLREELRGLGYSIIPTEALAALIVEARHQGMLEHAR
jgi:hypothetical protein